MIIYYYENNMYIYYIVLLNIETHTVYTMYYVYSVYYKYTCIYLYITYPLLPFIITQINILNVHVSSIDYILFIIMKVEIYGHQD